MNSRGIGAILVMLVVGCSERPGSQALGPIGPDRSIEPAIVAAVTEVDLGTLPGMNLSVATAVNDHGQIVGYSWSEGGGLRCFLWENGRMTDLGDLGGGDCQAFGINDQGIVVGRSLTAALGMRGFRWENGVMEELGTYPGEGYTEARRVNDAGQIIGLSGTHGVLWEGLQVLDLGFDPSDLNDRGQIVGVACPIPCLAADKEGILWSGGTAASLGDFFPLAIDELGRMAGTVGGTTPVLREDGTTLPLPLTPRDMNDDLRVAGYTLAPQHAAVWDNGTLVDLDTSPCETGVCPSLALGINGSGLIVGYSDTGESFEYPKQNGQLFNVVHATLWVVGSETPDAGIVDLIGDVLALGLDPGAEHGLTSILEAAGKLEAQGNGTGAANLLRAFAHRLEGLVQSGTVDETDARPLVDRANRLALQLGG